MNFQWTDQAAACPIIELHDIRTEKFRSEKYLTLVEDRLTGPFLAAGGHALGEFRVDNHPDRLLVLRGYPSMPARRRALAAFHAGKDWTQSRAEAAALTRDAQTLLLRTVRPSEGVRSIRAGERLSALISEVRFPEQIGNYHLWLRLLLRKAGMDPFAAFATLEAVNDVPAVPVVRHRCFHVALVRGHEKTPELPPEMRNMLRYTPEILGLEPAMSLVW
ncbi:MAG TPA: hypothetical protein VN109_08660 [Devosia sp.]|jgi:hypothetical protein|nr:hypothetical protein [Devosia sp.]